MNSINNHESTYGNEVKRRRINQAGHHLKVWQVCKIEYMPHEEKEKEEMKPVQEPVYEVQEPVHQDQDQDQVQDQVQDQEPPVQLIGRTVVLETTDQRICRGTIQGLFVLNGERAIHIQTDDGQNLVYTTSQLCAACVLHHPEEEVQVLSPIPRREEEEDEVVQIDDEEVVRHEVVRHEVVRHEVVHVESDDEEVQELTRLMRRIEVVRHEVVHVESDNESNASTKEYNDAYNDDSCMRSAEEEGEEPVCCAICFDSTDTARNFVSLNCGHQFHFACIMGNMANGGHNRNQCPMCRDRVIHADDDVQNLYALHQELNLMRQHREDLSAEYVRVMGMQLQINIRYHEEKAARDALERRAYICGLNERIAAVVVNAANNDIRHQEGAAVHTERQIRDLCMSFGMMAYDEQYDYQEYLDPDQEDPDRMD